MADSHAALVDQMSHVPPQKRFSIQELFLQQLLHEGREDQFRQNFSSLLFPMGPTFFLRFLLRSDQNAASSIGHGRSLMRFVLRKFELQSKGNNRRLGKQEIGREEPPKSPQKTQNSRWDSSHTGGRRLI
jgi:hypothetical protein